MIKSPIRYLSGWMPHLPPIQDVMDRTRWHWTRDEEHGSQQDTPWHKRSLPLDVGNSAGLCLIAWLGKGSLDARTMPLDGEIKQLDPNVNGTEARPE